MGGHMPGAEVLILGAGFSRAISDRMPLTDELGNAAAAIGDLAESVRTPPGGFRGGNFESWLSVLAEDQPYLDDAQNLANQALFLRFSAAIADVLGAAVNDVLSAAPPEWLSRLIRVAHRRRATLITFNYDPLVESVVATGLLYDPTLRQPVAWTEVIGDVPNWPAGSARWPAVPADTFRLLKLHGSSNWYWTPGDASGVSLARRSLPGRWGDPMPYSEEERRRELPGRGPFVVPPSATKSTFYRNPVTREIWRQAGDALRSAVRVTFLGYSLPLTDLTVANMIASSLLRGNAEVQVADLAPEVVRDRLAAIGVEPDRITNVEGVDSPISALSAAWAEDVAKDLADELRELVTLNARVGKASVRDLPMLVCWDEQSLAAVTEVTQGIGHVKLVVEDAGPFELATRARVANESKSLPTLRDVAATSAVGDRLLVTADTGVAENLINVETAPALSGHSGLWAVFTPDGPARLRIR
jgi:hypothetical protein